MNILDFKPGHKNLFLKLLYECESMGGLLVITPTRYKTVQYFSPHMINESNIQKNDIVLIYNTNDAKDLSFHEYVYISLSSAIENITSKAKATNYINLDLVEYIGELKYFLSNICDAYDLDI